MSNSTLTRGTRVRAFPGGELGTVANVPRISEQFKGFTPVIFDGRDKATPCDTQKLVAIEQAPAVGPAADTRVIHHATGVRGTLKSSNGDTADVEWDAAGVAMPFATLPVAGIEAFTVAEIEAELERRKDAAHAAELATSLEYLRKNPELATQTVTINKLAQAAYDTGLSAAPMFEAWGIVAGAGK